MYNAMLICGTWNSDILLAKWEMDYGTVMGWVHARLSYMILHATLLCVQESCTKWRALGLVDEMSIAIDKFCLFCFPIFICLVSMVSLCVTVVFLVSGFVI